MAKAGLDLNSITEPAADPTLPKAAEKPAALNLPTTQPERLKAKVSPRRDYVVKAIVDGTAYGPFKQHAVDESEAIQRLLDSKPQLKKLANRSKFQVKPVAA